MTYKATDSKIVKNPTKVRFYEIDGVTYESSGCFKDPTTSNGKSIRKLY